VQDVNKRLQAAVMRIRGDHPFLGTLALFAELKVSDEIETAATDGKKLFFNPTYVDKLDAAKLCGLVTHELLHAALQHVGRRHERNTLLWNIAADIVVNGMIRKDTRYDLPEGGVENPDLAHLSVEEIYEQLNAGKLEVPSILLLDLQGISSDGAGHSIQDAQSNQLQTHWRAAIQQASAMARRMGKGFGQRGLGQTRELLSATQEPLGWRELLSQFMISTPFDFQGFDRRFVHQKLYLEEMQGESVEVAIVIDTSGSIGNQELSAFMGEIQAILDAYPQIRGRLFFADSQLYGPYEFSRDAVIPPPKGGGGTSFCPFFEWADQQEDGDRPPLSIYFTDGYGSFPSTAATSPVLWVVMPGGLDSTEFPFGDVVRMAQ
jgi:predicted metal-dependent peptidase